MPPLPLLTLILACSGDGPDDSGGTTSSATDGATADGGTDTGSGCTECALSDAHSAPISSSLTVGSQDLLAATDATFDWSGLSTDIFGQPVSPDAVQTVTLYLFGALSDAEILAGLAQDELEQSAVRGFWTCLPTDARCDLSDFELVGHAFLPASDFPADTGPWLLQLGTDQGIRAMSFLAPTSTADSSLLLLTDDSSAAMLTSDLSAATALTMAAGSGQTLDWSALSVDGFGNALVHSRLDRVRIDRFDLSAKDVGAGLIGLDSLTTATWQAQTGGLSSLSLADLTGDSPWAGVSADATWLFTAWCSSCTLPVPHVVAQLQAP